ncbi:MAG: hypothetical protein AUK47_04660 [Deltaproteobacteria bacterium CG2_30_63_29]|nr:MAG: hypothetical protein AUK47_04660 [Deltaproteobacteria bacterium CG2_30_63_29]PJB42615.1 MAG: hypothetical protein CO108_11370 [Deltaproteobacteria bacterium CG_4_9_14_3_um_filter_63_12]
MEFVAGVKDILVDTWLINYQGVSHLVDRLRQAGIGPGNNPENQAARVEYIRRCRNSITLRSLLTQALLHFGDQDRREIDLGDLLVPNMCVGSP